MSEKSKREINAKGNTRVCNAARVSPLSGRFTPKTYSSPLDMSHLMSPEEFHQQYIRNKPGNAYTDDNVIVEEPHHDQPLSPETPVTATSASNTQRSDTQTSFGSSTYQENDEQAPRGW
jgi:hypothetical protein